MKKKPSLLILGGTALARILCEKLVSTFGGRALIYYSLAGLTKAPLLPRDFSADSGREGIREGEASSLSIRFGGFGGVEGLLGWLKAQDTTLVINATHPFATQMSGHAIEACQKAGIPLIRLERPSWVLPTCERLQHCSRLEDAPKWLESVRPSRVFLTIGAKGLSLFNHFPSIFFLIRLVSPPESNVILPPLHRLIKARGPFNLQDEKALLETEKIDALIAKNSGGTRGDEKIRAGLALSLDILLVDPPAPSRAESVYFTRNIEQTMFQIQSLLGFSP